MSAFPFLLKPTVLQPQLPQRVKYHYQDPLLLEGLSETFNRYLEHLDPHWKRPLVLVGIGTDRSTGDCLGPLVGNKLNKQNLPNFHVYGTLDEPVHAANLAEKLAEIHKRHFNPLIIAIDACLGQSESVGSIALGFGALKPGAGVNKSLPPVGDLHFTGIVNVGGYMEYFVLQNTRLSLVMKMSDQIATVIVKGCRQAHRAMEEAAPASYCQ